MAKSATGTAAASSLLAALLILCAVLVGCVPPTATSVKHKEPVKTLIVGATGRPPREGPLMTPTLCPPMLPAFWPTGMPPPTRGPAAVKRAIPTDKETCLEAGGFWDTPFCTGLMCPTDIPPPEQSCWEVPTGDAHRPCSDDSECEGWCSVPPGGQRPPMTGICSPIARQWQWKRMAILNGQVVEQIRECE